MVSPLRANMMPERICQYFESVIVQDVTLAVQPLAAHDNTINEGMPYPFKKRSVRRSRLIITLRATGCNVAVTPGGVSPRHHSARDGL